MGSLAKLLSNKTRRLPNHHLVCAAYKQATESLLSVKTACLTVQVALAVTSKNNKDGERQLTRLGLTLNINTDISLQTESDQKGCIINSLFVSTTHLLSSIKSET